jgi:hypothetical protein
LCSFFPPPVFFSFKSHARLSQFSQLMSDFSWSLLQYELVMCKTTNGEEDKWESVMRISRKGWRTDQDCASQKW